MSETDENKSELDKLSAAVREQQSFSQPSLPPEPPRPSEYEMVCAGCGRRNAVGSELSFGTPACGVCGEILGDQLPPPVGAKKSKPLNPFVPPLPMWTGFLGIWLVGVIICWSATFVGKQVLAEEVQAAANRIRTPDVSSEIGAENKPQLPGKFNSWFILSGVVALYTLIVLLVFYYWIWAALRCGPSSMGPVTAIVLLFVPGVNLIWMFFAIAGWAKEFNRFIRVRKLDVAPVSEVVPLFICILTLLSLPLSIAVLVTGKPRLELLMTFFAIMQLILTGFFIVSASTAVSNLSDIEPVVQAKVAPPPIPQGR